MNPVANTSQKLQARIMSVDIHTDKQTVDRCKATKNPVIHSRCNKKKPAELLYSYRDSNK